jgi:hypothetical protein
MDATLRASDKRGQPNGPPQSADERAFLVELARAQIILVDLQMEIQSSRLNFDVDCLQIQLRAIKSLIQLLEAKHWSDLTTFSALVELRELTLRLGVEYGQTSTSRSAILFWVGADWVADAGWPLCLRNQPHLS